MQKNNYFAQKLIVFAAGIAVLAVMFILLAPTFEYRQDGYIFSCVVLSTVYLSVFLPVLLVGVGGNVASFFAAGAVYYKAMITYIIVSVIDIVLALTIAPMTLVIVIQCIGAFVFIIWAAAASFAKSHIDNVQQSEDVKKSAVVELRAKAQRLSAMAASCENAGLRAAVEKIAEDMRYLSPAASAEAHDMECRMLKALDSMLIDNCFTAQNSGYPDSINQKLKDFELLYAQRKTMY